MTSNDKLPPARPVYVSERIPIGGANAIEAEEIAQEKIPTPAHLQLYPELGRGGMGRIHPATDRNLLRYVALKRLDAGLAADAVQRGSFVAEAQITGQLEHPNVVPVHELAVSPQGVPYFTMKLVQGTTMFRWLYDRKRPPGSTERLQEGLEILLKVCDALAYAHHRGVLHRDLKPDNVMIGEFGQVYLMDWGLALVRDPSGHVYPDATEEVLGTPAYMAPEQARGYIPEVDVRSDVFGIGAILYHLVSGKVPYGELHDQEKILAMARAGDVIPIHIAAEGLGIPRRMLEIVAKATAVVPAERYQSVAELQSELRAFLRGGLHLPHCVFESGELILREGAAGTSAYMILSGRCRAFRVVNGRRESLAVMGPGDVFGEMALLLDEPRAASVEAMERVVAVSVDRRAMEEGVGGDGWVGALVRALALRFRQLEQQMRDLGVRRPDAG